MLTELNYHNQIVFYKGIYILTQCSIQQYTYSKSAVYRNNHTQRVLYIEIYILKKGYTYYSYSNSVPHTDIHTQCSIQESTYSKRVPDRIVHIYQCFTGMSILKQCAR